MITDALHRIANHRLSLSRQEARDVMAEVLAGKCTDAQIAALLVALHMKGETVEEIVGLAEAIRAAATPLQLTRNSTVDVSGTERDALVDTCGTGGDASGTFNVSTATALVVAGVGVKVDLPTERLAACLEQVGFVFLFAPSLHSAMKHVQTARRELKLRTVFNLLGPLTNPAHASGQVVGVYSSELVEKLAEALSMLGLRRALVVNGDDGLDEITITGASRVAEVRDGQVHTYEVTPEEFGIDRAPIQEISGGDAAANASLILQILDGEKSPRRDVVVLNAAAALVAGGKTDHLRDAIPIAIEAIDSGAARKKLEAVIAYTQA